MTKETAPIFFVVLYSSKRKHRGEKNRRVQYKQMWRTYGEGEFTANVEHSYVGLQKISKACFDQWIPASATIPVIPPSFLLSNQWPAVSFVMLSQFVQCCWYPPPPLPDPMKLDGKLQAVVYDILPVPESDAWSETRWLTQSRLRSMERNCSPADT